MSASQEKKKRREERVEGKDKKQIQRASTARKKKRNKIIGSIIAVVVVVLILFAAVFNSTLFYSHASALDIGDHDYTAVEFNYYYQSAYMSAYSSISSTYGQYASYLLDPSKPLSEQSYSEDMTWDEYLEQQALDSMQQSAMLCDAAEEEGFTISEEVQANIDQTIASEKAAATEQGYNSFKKYLTTAYGRGFDEKTYEKLVTNQNLAAAYSQVLIDRFTEEYTDEQLMDKYNSVQSEYNLITYCYYYVDGSADDEAGIDADTAMNNAYTTAQAIAAAKTEDVFAELVRQYCTEEEKESFADDSAVLRKNVAPGSLSDNYSEWLTSADRKYGDTTCIEGTNGYYVLLFVESNHNDYTLKNFRHILVKAEADADSGEITGESILAAQTKAEQLYEQWKEDPTEENFAAMANENSDDTGSNTNGGLYENVAQGRMVSEIDEWLFNSGRKAGDTELVYVKSSNYTGYHILYFSGEGEQYNLEIAKGLQQQDDYEQWISDRSGSYEINKRFAFRFAK